MRGQRMVEAGSAIWIAIMFVATVLLTGVILDTVNAHKSASHIMSSVVDYYTFDDANDTSMTLPHLGSDPIVWTPDVYYDCTYAQYGCAADLDGTTGTANITLQENAATISTFLEIYNTRFSGNILNFRGITVYTARRGRLTISAADGKYVRYQIPTGTYVHLTVTCADGGQLAVYVNGELVGSTDVTTCYDSNIITLYTSSVLVDELKIFDRVLTEKEVSNLFYLEKATQLAAVHFIPANLLDDMEAMARLVFYLMLLVLIGMSWAYFTGTPFELDAKYMLWALISIALTYVLMLSAASGTNVLSFMHVVELGQDAWQIVYISLAISLAFLATAFLKLV